MSAARRYLALGDSYTIGEGVLPAERWPVQLVQALRARGLYLYEPQIVATTGWTTDELAAGMDAAQLSPPYHLVSLLIGVNNQYRGRSAPEYAVQFHHLLTRAIALAGGDPAHVMVLSIPDWGVTRFAADHGRDQATIGRALDTFNALARDQAKAAGASFVDITELSRRHPHELVDDGLHPSAAQYARWVTRLLPVARAVLG